MFAVGCSMVANLLRNCFGHSIYLGFDSKWPWCSKLAFIASFIQHRIASFFFLIVFHDFRRFFSGFLFFLLSFEGALLLLHFISFVV